MILSKEQQQKQFMPRIILEIFGHPTSSIRSYINKYLRENTLKNIYKQKSI